MSDRELPGVQELFDTIAGCLPRAVAFDGLVVRSVGVRYASAPDFLSGQGAARHGGRWNRPRLPAVYASLDVLTAVKESYQNLLQYGFGATDLKPRVIAGANVNLHCLLDLTSANTRRKLGFTLAELLEEDWRAIQDTGQESWTQAIGRGSLLAGFEGLIVPSVRNRPSGKNLVYFPGHLSRASHVRLCGRKDLPPHPSQWPP